MRSRPVIGVNNRESQPIPVRKIEANDFALFSEGLRAVLIHTANPSVQKEIRGSRTAVRAPIAACWV